MLRRPSPPSIGEKLRQFVNWKKLLGVGAACELGFLGFSYFFWNRLNRDIEARYFCYDKVYWVLDAYYSMGEFFDKEYKARERDLDIWRGQGKI